MPIPKAGSAQYGAYCLTVYLNLSGTHKRPNFALQGYAHAPYEWSASVVDIQLLRVGQLVMLIMPGEFTTMAGRRMREAVRAKLISSGVIGNDAYVVIAGPANTYGHYVTTREEYGVQRYEGASTLYGPCMFCSAFVTMQPLMGAPSHARGVHRQVHEPRALPRANRERDPSVRRAVARAN